MESMYASDTLAVSPVARHLAHEVLSGAGSWLRIPSWYRALTAHLLRPRLREGFGLAYGEREQTLGGARLKLDSAHPSPPSGKCPFRRAIPGSGRQAEWKVPPEPERAAEQQAVDRGIDALLAGRT